MTLKNVEVIEQEQHEQSWFQKFRSKFGRSAVSSAVVTTGVLAATGAHAELPDFFAPVTAAFSGIEGNLATLFLTCIGITLMIIIFVISRGGIKKAGSS
jgi:hypothetical protein